MNGLAIAVQRMREQEAAKKQEHLKQQGKWKDFDKTDWDAYAGAERFPGGQDPIISSFNIPDVLEVHVIACGLGFNITFLDPNGKYYHGYSGYKPMERWQGELFCETIRGICHALVARREHNTSFVIGKMCFRKILTVSKIWSQHWDGYNYNKEEL